MSMSDYYELKMLSEDFYNNLECSKIESQLLEAVESENLVLVRGLIEKMIQYDCAINAFIVSKINELLLRLSKRINNEK